MSALHCPMVKIRVLARIWKSSGGQIYQYKKETDHAVFRDDVCSCSLVVFLHHVAIKGDDVASQILVLIHSLGDEQTHAVENAREELEEKKQIQ